MPPPHMLPLLHRASPSTVLRCLSSCQDLELMGGRKMAKIRHIAIRAEDVEATAKLFTEVFGLELVQRREHGPIDLSDGDVNITLLPLRIGGREDEERPGYSHIGFTVAAQDETKRRLLATG